MLPIVELRGSIVYASANDINYIIALIIAVLGNMLPVPFILLLFNFMYNLLCNIRFIGPILKKVSIRAEEKSKKIGKYEFIGLYLFVAIPLPGTGAWTGALVATVLKLDFFKSLFSILLGVITSGFIMGILAYLLPDVFNFLLG